MPVTSLTIRFSSESRILEFGLAFIQKYTRFELSFYVWAVQWNHSSLYIKGWRHTYSQSSLTINTVAEKGRAYLIPMITWLIPTEWNPRLIIATAPQNSGSTYSMHFPNQSCFYEHQNSLWGRLDRKKRELSQKIIPTKLSEWLVIWIWGFRCWSGVCSLPDVPLNVFYTRH